MPSLPIELKQLIFGFLIRTRLGSALLFRLSKRFRGVVNDYSRRRNSMRLGDNVINASAVYVFVEFTDGSVLQYASLPHVPVRAHQPMRGFFWVAACASPRDVQRVEVFIYGIKVELMHDEPFNVNYEENTLIITPRVDTSDNFSIYFNFDDEGVSLANLNNHKFSGRIDYYVSFRFFGIKLINEPHVVNVNPYDVEFSSPFTFAGMLAHAADLRGWWRNISQMPRPVSTPYIPSDHIMEASSVYVRVNIDGCVMTYASLLYSNGWPHHYAFDVPKSGWGEERVIHSVDVMFFGVSLDTGLGSKFVVEEEDDGGIRININAEIYEHDEWENDANDETLGIKFLDMFNIFIDFGEEDAKNLKNPEFSGTINCEFLFRAVVCGSDNERDDANLPCDVWAACVACASRLNNWPNQLKLNEYRDRCALYVSRH